MSTPSNYLKAEQAFVTLTSLKKGSTVKVLRVAKDREHGWPNSWNKSNMDKQVGKTLTVDRISTVDTNGIFCNDGYYYPFFVLEVVQPENVSIKLESGSYTAIVHGGSGDIKVGCQNISFAMVEKLYKAAVKARGPVEVIKAPDIAAAKKTAAKKTAKKVAAKKTSSYR